MSRILASCILSCMLVGQVIASQDSAESSPLGSPASVRFDDSAIEPVESGSLLLLETLALNQEQTKLDLKEMIDLKNQVKQLQELNKKFVASRKEQDLKLSVALGENEILKKQLQDLQSAKADKKSKDQKKAETDLKEGLERLRQMSVQLEEFQAEAHLYASKEADFLKKIRDLESANKGHKNEIARLEEQCEFNKKQNDNLIVELKRKTKKLDKQSLQTEGKAKEIESLKAELYELKIDLDKSKQHLNDKVAENRSMKDSLAKVSDQAVKVKKEFSEKVEQQRLRADSFFNENAMLKEKLADLESILTVLKQNFKAKEDKNLEQEAQLAKIGKQLEEKNQHNESLLKENGVLKTQVEGQKKVVEGMVRDMQVLSNDNARLKESLKSQEDELLISEGARAKLNAELMMLEEELEERQFDSEVFQDVHDKTIHSHIILEENLATLYEANLRLQNEVQNLQARTENAQAYDEQYVQQLLVEIAFLKNTLRSFNVLTQAATQGN